MQKPEKGIRDDWFVYSGNCAEKGLTAFIKKVVDRSWGSEGVEGRNQMAVGTVRRSVKAKRRREGRGKANYKNTLM